MWIVDDVGVQTLQLVRPCCGWAFRPIRFAFTVAGPADPTPGSVALPVTDPVTTVLNGVFWGRIVIACGQISGGGEFQENFHKRATDCDHGAFAVFEKVDYFSPRRQTQIKLNILLEHTIGDKIVCISVQTVFENSSTQLYHVINIFIETYWNFAHFVLRVLDSKFQFRI